METIRWIRTKKEIQHRMLADVFSARPIDAKTARYCATDVVHLPELHALYLRRIQGDWLAMATEESPRRVAEAHSPRIRASVAHEEARTVGFGS